MTENPHSSRTAPRRRALALCLSFLLAACALASCAGGSESRSIITAKPPDSSSGQVMAAAAPEAASSTSEATALPAEDAPMFLSVAARLLTGQTSDEQGCYMLYTYVDGSADIHYIDYAAMEMRELDLPEKQEGLNGRIADCWGGVKPVLAGDSLFIFRLGGSTELMEAHGTGGLASIMRTGRDGGAATPVYFPEHYTFQLSSAILYDGQSLYFLMVDNDAEKPTFVLMQLDCESLEYTELHRLEHGYTYTLEGYWEMGPVLCGATTLPPVDDPAFTAARDSQQFVLFNMGMGTGAQYTLAQWAQGDTNYMQDTEFYHWNDEEAALYAIGANTGEGRLIAQGFAPDKYDYVYLQRSLVDGWLRIQFTLPGGSRNSYFSVNALTGEVTQPPIDGLGENIIVYAELADALLVRYDEKWVHRDKLDPDIDPMSLNGGYNRDYVNMPEYALIAKSDYWAGQRRFDPIKDLIYA